MITLSFLVLSSQISEKTLAQSTKTAKNMTVSSGNASMMMTNKTTANSDVLMTKVRNMGIGNSSTAAGSNMTNQTSG